MTVDRRQVFSCVEFEICRTVSHPVIDVGLIEISPPFASLEGLAFRQARIAEEIFTLGYPRIPLSREPTLVMHRGEVTNSQVTIFSGQTLFLYSAIARPGNSGGPIISSKGDVVGMVTEELRDDADPNSQFYAGVGALEIARAVSELGVSVIVPIEDYRTR
jgi:Trypsin-like peptidase domain